jgi:hypothetical protein
VLAEALGDHEELLWAGQPRPGVRFSKADLLLVPFSLVWGGFALVWEAGVLFAHAPWFLCIWGVPFVLMGQYIIWGRFLVDARRRSRTFYGLTQDRWPGMPGTSRSTAFEHVDDVYDVYQKILALQASSRAERR